MALSINLKFDATLTVGDGDIKELYKEIKYDPSMGIPLPDYIVAQIQNAIAEMQHEFDRAVDEGEASDVKFELNQLEVSEL